MTSFVAFDNGFQSDAFQQYADPDAPYVDCLVTAFSDGEHRVFVLYSDQDSVEVSP